MLPGNTQMATEMLKTPEKQEVKCALEDIAATGRSFRNAVDGSFQDLQSGCLEESRGFWVEERPVCCFCDELDSDRPLEQQARRQ